MLVIAADTATREDAIGVLIGLGTIVAMAVVAGIVGFVVWRRFTREDVSTVTRETAFTLADLRQLHREGQLNDEEFERARAAIIAQTRAALARDEPADSTAADPIVDFPDDPAEDSDKAPDGDDPDAVR
jgi:hypothetical protein